MRKCFYKILEVSRHSSDKDIKAAFIRLAKIYHPDVNKSKNNTVKNDKDSDDISRKFRDIHEAYTALKDAQSRSLYEHSLLGYAAPSSSTSTRYQSGE